MAQSASIQYLQAFNIYIYKQPTWFMSLATPNRGLEAGVLQTECATIDYPKPLCLYWSSSRIAWDDWATPDITWQYTLLPN